MSYFVKIIQEPKEFLIAKKLDLPMWNKVISLSGRTMTSKMIQGKTLYEMLPELDLQEFISILHGIFYALFKAWKELGLVHGDLHLKNIMIECLQAPISFPRLAHNESLFPFLGLDQDLHLANYLPVIVDLEQATVEQGDVEQATVEQCDVEQATTKRTFLHDVWKLLGCLHMYLTHEKGEYVLECIGYFIDPFEFQERKEEFVKTWFNELPY